MKKALLAHCLQLAEAKVLAMRAEVLDLQGSFAQEGKSTAGDKHETGRAMMHIEMARIEAQLAKAQILVADLQRIDPQLRHIRVGPGSVVDTDKGRFFLAAGLGTVNFEGSTIHVISPDAPMAVLLIGKMPGDRFRLGAVEYLVADVE